MPFTERNHYLKIVMTAIIVAIATINFTATLDKRAEQPIGEAFERALITYGVVRGINAVISVMQGTEFAIEPAGVGVILTPGEVLDPVNDLIERFSLVVLIASTSLGAQKILVGIGATVLVQLIVALALAIQLVSLWRPALLASAWGNSLLKVSLLLVMLRFLIPSTVLLNNVVYEHYLDQQYTDSYIELEQTRQNVEALQNAESNQEEGGILGLVSRASQRLNFNARLEEYEQRLASASEQIIDLIVVFVLQTLLFPLLFLWLGLKVIRMVFGTRMIFYHQHVAHS